MPRPLRCRETRRNDRRDPLKPVGKHARSSRNHPPQYVIWENVRGALSAKAASERDLESEGRPMGRVNTGHLRALGRVCGDLAEIGYDARWTTLRASDIGAPHHRARVFLVATPAAT